MEAVVKAENLKLAMRKLAGVDMKQATIMRVYRVTANATGLCIGVGDGIHYGEITVGAEVRSEGKCYIGREDAGVLFSMTEGDVLLRKTEVKLEVQWKKRKSTLPLRESSGYHAEFGSIIWQQSDGLGKLLKRVLYACKHGDYGAMGNVYFDHSARVAVAVDGHRMAVSSIPEGCLDTFPMTFMLPRTSAERLVQWTGEGNVSLGITGEKVSVQQDAIGYTARYTCPLGAEQDKFPDWKHFMTAITTTLHSDAETKDLQRAIADSIKVARRAEHPLVLTVQKDVLTIAASDGDCSMVTDVDAKTTEDEPKSLRIGVNPKYLLDAIESVDGHIVRLGFKSESEPMVIIVDGDVRGILMPMKI